jgi:hypothetical protein
VAEIGTDVDSLPHQLVMGGASELVVSEDRQEEARARELRELHGGDRPAAADLLPGAARVRDLARAWNAIDARELDPLDVPDDGHALLAAHGQSGPAG